MTSNDEKEEIAKAMNLARKKSRGYADFFGCATDRDLEELAIATTLQEALEANNAALFKQVVSRGRRNDPPDCEALDASGKRIAIEVTELVEGQAIQKHKCGSHYEWADWSREKFLSQMKKLIANKGKRHTFLKDGPYDGGYVILVFTDEPELRIETVKHFLDGQEFVRPPGVTHTFLLLSYDPGTKSYPYFHLNLSG